MQAMKNVIAGFDTTVCIDCSNGAQSSFRDNYSVQQTSQCFSSLAPVKTDLNTRKTNLIFDKSLPDKALTTGWSDLFVNSLTTACPITKCTIMQAGCEKAYTAGNLYIDTKNNFALMAK